MAQLEPMTDTEALERLVSDVSLQVRVLGRAIIASPEPMLTSRLRQKLTDAGLFVKEGGPMWVIERAF